MTNNEKEMLKLFNVEELEKRYEMRSNWLPNSVSTEIKYDSASGFSGKVGATWRLGG